MRVIFTYFILLICLQAETVFSCRLHFDETRYFHESVRYKKAEETLSFSRVAFLLSEFSFTGKSGKTYPVKGPPFYLEAEKKRNSVTLPTPPTFPEEVVALNFSVGLPPALNLANPNTFASGHSLNPIVNNLHWSQETGYIFMALEGMWRSQDDNELKGFSLHYANAHNLLPISLKLPEEALSLKGMQISLDLAEVLKGVSFRHDGFTTHSQPHDPIANKLRENLQSAFAIERINGDLPALSKKQKSIKKPPLYLPSEKEHLTGYPLKIGKNLPIPTLPSDNPLLKTRVELGKKLFHDPLLSKDNSLSCAKCHQEHAAHAESAPLSTGINGSVGTRNSMPLFNLAWKSEFFWDGRAPSLRQQVLDPITDPHELGEDMESLEKKLQATDHYPELFSQAFNNAEITEEKISLALEAFLLTLTSYDSRFDRAIKGAATLTAQEQKGFKLFMTEYEPRLGTYGADCFHCHGGALFTDNHYHNNGLGDLEDLGRFNATQKETDKGKFQTPSLRNIALTAPYMHDGRFQTLEEVIRHYTAGLKRPSELSPLDANLAKHGGRGIPLSDEDQAALIAFLKTLSDDKYLSK